jgi:hypothetical protein
MNITFKKGDERSTRGLDHLYQFESSFPTHFVLHCIENLKVDSTRSVCFISYVLPFASTSLLCSLLNFRSVSWNESNMIEEVEA